MPQSDPIALRIAHSWRIAGELGARRRKRRQAPDAMPRLLEWGVAALKPARRIAQKLRRKTKEGNAMIAKDEIRIPKDAIAELCRSKGISKMKIFDPALHVGYMPDYHPDATDVDVYVEFEPGRMPGFAFFGIQRELTEMLGVGVCLRTLPELREELLEALDDAEILYAAE